MNKKILIIEDEQYLVDMYTTKFELEGYTVTSALDGPEGIKLAKKIKPDLILLDLVMPKMDGFEVLAQLRKLPEIKATKIYIFSNLGQTSEVEKGLGNGADGYFVKSNLTPSQLVNKVNNIFAGKNVSDEKVSVKPRKQSKCVGKVCAPEGKGLMVLLMEDERPILHMYQERLESEGMNVTATANGAWGLAQAKSKKFDVIIMDMNMPAMNGFRSLQEIKKSETNKNTPVMIVSNSAQDEEIERAKQLGADCFFLKAKITPSRLISEIKKRYAS
jgi:CheY-like chemotaxis protein